MSRPMAMRDIFLERVRQEMEQDSTVFFLTADFGSPVLDRIRQDFSDRFVNVGIAEQNLVNLAAGLALEGFRVFTYAIAPFYLRAYEQIRINLSMLFHGKGSVNMIAVGAGCSYVIAGPSHHCFEDLSAMRLLPGIEMVSPSDAETAGASFERTRSPGIRYFRFDAWKLPSLTEEGREAFPKEGFRLLRDCPEPECVFVSTGYMTHFAVRTADRLSGQVRIRHVDLLDFRPEERAFSSALKAPLAVSLEEGFVGRGGLDALVWGHLQGGEVFRAFGIPDRFEFAGQDRESTLRKYGLTEEHVAEEILQFMKEKKL